jgi:hypothetical protein
LCQLVGLVLKLLCSLWPGWPVRLQVRPRELQSLKAQETFWKQLLNLNMN